MGVTFRSGNYVRFVRIGGRTIKDGESAVIWNRKGVSRQVEGPERVHLFFCTIRFLDRFKAEPHQYLVVKHRSGKVAHVPGPVSYCMNPVMHDSMDVKDGIKLETKDDCIVIFSSKFKKTECSIENVKETPFSSERRVIYGPTIYFPSEGETIHTFNWTRFPLDKHSDSREQFKVLTIHKINLWNCSLAITTEESSSVNLKLAISYRIESIEKCLSIDDPIPMLNAALLSDASNCNRNESDIMQWITEESTFPTLCQTMVSLGFRMLKIQVLKVVPSEEYKERKQTQNKEDKKKATELDNQIRRTEQLYSSKLNFLMKLIEMGIDVTKVLCASQGKAEVIAENIGKLSHTLDNH